MAWTLLKRNNIDSVTILFLWKNAALSVIQVYSCTMEKKNRYFFVHLQSLVSWNLSQNGEGSFLQIGHTLKDNDQVFSQVLKRLRKANAVCRTDLHSELWATFGEQKTVVNLKKSGQLICALSLGVRARKCTSFFPVASLFVYQHSKRLVQKRWGTCILSGQS